MIRHLLIDKAPQPFEDACDSPLDSEIANCLKLISEECSNLKSLWVIFNSLGDTRFVFRLRKTSTVPPQDVSSAPLDAPEYASTAKALRSIRPRLHVLGIAHPWNAKVLIKLRDAIEPQEPWDREYGLPVVKVKGARRPKCGAWTLDARLKALA